ncbi:MAG: hypothetical protein OEX23_09450 [Betaproteobacteria bacterium]|jgi:hypothetical protein|nr:hypothetical protein [Betaproteobacteria bacterium]
MVQRRLHRRLVAWLVAFCVVFAQSAAIAYACQRDALPDAGAVPCAAHLAQQVPDDDAKLAGGNVCEVHCQVASLPDAGSADVPAPDAVVAWQLPLQPVALAPAAPVADLEAKSASPPPRTLYARLLI